MSFESLDKETLYRTAVEDFGVDVKPTDSKKVILAALAEDGVKWVDYQRAHPDTVPAGDDDFEAPTGVVTSESMGNSATGGNVVVEAPVVRTAAPAVNVSTQDMYLIKMHRDNPYFEFRGYKFTADHPYVVMPAAAADAILREEEGFAIATPSEASEYYG